MALAVGLTPEFLPMIMAVTLAQGAVHMARRKVIVKHLAALQNFGSMDVLCADKTGTLTSGVMVLDSAFDSLGRPEPRPLQLAYLNSLHETGIKSPLDAAIVFAPAGEIVPAALRALDKGGTLVLGGIHMSPIPEIEYAAIWGEREVRSVANNTRADARAFLDEAARTGVRTHVQCFRLDEANEALSALRHDAVKGAAVLVTE